MELNKTIYQSSSIQSQLIHLFEWKKFATYVSTEKKIEEEVGRMEASSYAEKERSEEKPSKAWFPYNRPDRPGRSDRWKYCTADPGDYMETVTEN